MRIVVYGAGAVGSVLGGMLSLRQHDVLLIGRPRLADAIRAEGLRIKSATGEYLAHPRAASTLGPSDVDETTRLLLTVKSGDVAAAAAELAARVPRDTPIVCFQNGVASEGVVAEQFPSVYGGVCRMTCSMLQGGHASYRAPGRLIVGRYPSGLDATSRALAEAFAEAGFDAAGSRSIRSDKWLKMAVNSQSVLHAVVDPRDHDDDRLGGLMVSLLEEDRRVFRAARIRPRSCDGRDPSIREMIEDLKRPRAKRSDHGVKVHNSTWQDLYLKRDRLEAEYLHGPIIALGREHGVPTPLNQAVLEIAQRCHESGAGPESMRFDAVLDVVSRHVAS